MENQTTSVESLLEKIRNYVETRLDLLKLKAIDKSAGVLSAFVSMLIIILILFICIILLNVGLALLIGECLGKAWYGFFIMAGVNALAGLVLYLARNKWVKTPMSNSLIKNLLD